MVFMIFGEFFFENSFFLKSMKKTSKGRDFTPKSRDFNPKNIRVTFDFESKIANKFHLSDMVNTSVRKQLDFIIEFAGYRTKQPSIKQLTARPLISQKTVFKRAVLSCF